MKLIKIFLLTFLLVVSAAGQSYNWQLIQSNAPFAPRDGAGGVVAYSECGNNGREAGAGGGAAEDKLVMIGGWNPMDSQNFPLITNNEIWSSSDGITWTLTKPNTFNSQFVNNGTDWEGRHTAGYVVHNGKIFIVGSDPNQGHYQNDVWSSCDGGKTWQRVTTNAPWGDRVLHNVFSFDGKIWVMGGQTIPQFAPAPDVLYRDIWTSPNGKDWTKIDIEVDSCHPLWAAGRGTISGSVVFQGRMWLVGGGTYPTPSKARSFSNEVWSSQDGRHWKLHPQTSISKFNPRQYNSVVVWDNKIWVIAGYDENFTNRKDVWYSPDGENWTEVENSPFAIRHAATVISKTDGIYLFGGNSFDKKVWKLTK